MEKFLNMLMNSEYKVEIKTKDNFMVFIESGDYKALIQTVNEQFKAETDIIVFGKIGVRRELIEWYIINPLEIKEY